MNAVDKMEKMEGERSLPFPRQLPP